MLRRKTLTPTETPRLHHRLRRSLCAADALEAQSRQAGDPALRRLLLKASCDVLDRSLEAAQRAVSTSAERTV